MAELLTDPILVGHVAQAPILECPPEISVGEAVARMCEARRGSILAVTDGEVAGILTVDDIVRLNVGDPTVLDQPVAAVMSSPVKTIRQDAALREAAFRFRAERYRHLVVTDAGGRRTGIISQTDVINHQGLEFFVHLRDVRSVMHDDPIVVPSATPVVDAIRLMRECRQDAVIVDDGNSHGVFTATDVLGCVRDRAWQSPVGLVAHFPLQSVTPDASLFQARSLFVEYRIRHLGVMAGKQLVGLLTYNDMMACVEQVYLRDMHRTIADRSGRLLMSQQALAVARVLAESLPQGVIITEAQGTIESVNPAFTAITGYAPEEVIGKNPRILGSGRHDAGFFQQMFATLAERGSWSGEIWNRRKDGEIISELLTVTAVRGIDGAIGNYVGVFANITEQKRAQEALLDSPALLADRQNLYRVILDTLPINVFVKDGDQRYLLANDHAAAFFGVPKDQLAGRTDFDLFPSETAERMREADQAVLDGLSQVVDETMVTLRGSEVCLLSHKRGVELGGWRLMIGASLDITSRRLAEQRLADEREVLGLIAANAPQAEILEDICRRVERYLHGGFAAIQVLDDEGRRLRNGGAPNLPADYLAAVDGLEIGPAAGSSGAAAWLAEPVIAVDIANDPHWSGLRDLAGQHSMRACWATPVLSADRKVLGTFAVYFRSPRQPNELDNDLVQQGTRLAAIAVERARAGAQLHRMATIDTLTGLPNRQHFFSLAQRELLRAARSRRPMAAFMLDIDHFKQINDTHGHAGGDVALRALAGRLAEGVRASDVCGRLGGEEFAVLLPETDQMTAIMVAERLRKRARAVPVDLGGGRQCGITVSIGVAMLLDGDDLDHLLQRADQALYAAKRGGRDQVANL